MSLIILCIVTVWAMFTEHYWIGMFMLLALYGLISSNYE